MVALQPALFLNRTPDQIRAQVGGAHDIISRALPPAYVDAMIQVGGALLRMCCCPCNHHHHHARAAHRRHITPCSSGAGYL